METFRVKAVPSEGTCTLVLSGEADLAVAPDIVELGALSLGESSVTTLIADLDGVTFIDSTSIGALIHLRNAAKERDKRFLLARVPARVSRVLQVAGLDTVFDIARADPSELS
jgi:anti-sigma B factor antagonist